MMARILLLEDDPDQLEFRKLLLENAGHHVQTAASASEATASAAVADVIVLDLVPGAEDLLAGLPETARVVVLSGREVVSKAVAARSACLLRKPCSSRTLIEAISRISRP
jgi:DNA-binding response OmpR family regulator